MNRTLYIIIIFSLTFSTTLIENVAVGSKSEYMTSEDGAVRMNINIIGNVARPGTYLVYDGIDFMSAISAAGGYLQGSNLNSILIYSKDGSTQKINLNHLINSNKSNFKLKPHDTIFVSEKFMSKFLTTSNLPYTILGLLNIAITLNNN